MPFSCLLRAFCPLRASCNFGVSSKIHNKASKVPNMLTSTIKCLSPSSSHTAFPLPLHMCTALSCPRTFAHVASLASYAFLCFLSSHLLLVLIYICHFFKEAFSNNTILPYLNQVSLQSPHYILIGSWWFSFSSTFLSQFDEGKK